MGLFDKTHSPKRNKRANKSGPIDPPIQDGDFIRIASVPTQIENAVFLAGAVRNPGPYEFRPGMRLKDLLTPEQMLIDSYLDRAELVRTHPVSYEVTVIPFSPSALFSGTEDNPPLRRLDRVLVGTQLKLSRTVNLVGEVKRSGIFTLQHGERLSSVLKRAGGFTPNAFPPGIVLVRESVKRKQQLELRRFLATERQQLAAESAAVAAGRAEVVAQGAASNPEQQVLALRLSQLDAVVSRVELGRVVVQLESIAKLEGTEDDVRLEGGDHITIPQPPQTVSVIGAVKTPSNLVHRTGLSLEGYLQHAGGPTKDADRDETYVVRASGSTDSAYIGLKDIGPGDTIVVPTKIEAKTPQLLLWQSIASIVGSLALTAAGISVIATN
jgi:protein involved in polysaccharide export with SLBB domain